MKALYAPNENFIKQAKTYITSDVAAGSNITINVENSESFAVDDYVVIGLDGTEQAEMQKITAKTTTSITVATLSLPHKNTEQIVKYRYNQRKFYGSLTESGTYVELTSYGSPVAIKVTDPQGTLLEYTGSEGYTYFKATYYNSTNSTESNIDDCVAVPGDQSNRYTSIYAIRKHAGLIGNPYYSDDRIEVKRQQAENEINSFLFSIYVLPLTEVPALISNVCELLAAGYIDFEEFGGEGEGVKWLGVARGILKSITEGRQRLIGADGEQLAEKTLTQGVQSYPDTVDNENGPIRVFTMNQRF